MTEWSHNDPKFILKSMFIFFPMIYTIALKLEIINSYQAWA